MCLDQSTGRTPSALRGEGREEGEERGRGGRERREGREEGREGGREGGRGGREGGRGGWEERGKKEGKEEEEEGWIERRIYHITILLSIYDPPHVLPLFRPTTQVRRSRVTHSSVPQHRYEGVV